MLHSTTCTLHASQQQAPYILHSTAGGMAFLINIGYTTTSLVNQLIADEVLTLVAKFTIIPVAVFMEGLISTVKNNYSRSQKCFDHLTTFFCMTVIPLRVLLLIHPQVTILCIITCLFHTHSCLHTASVSKAKKWFSDAF